MIRTYLAGLTWLALWLGNVTAQETARHAEGQPPGFCLVTEIDMDTIELKGAGAAVNKCVIKDLEILDAAGKKLTADDLRKRVKAGSVVVVASDENSIDPVYLKSLKEDTVVLLGATVLMARADNPGRGWTMDVKKMKPSNDPVTGKIAGVNFNLDKIELLNTGLSLRSGNDSIHMFLNLKPGRGIEGKTFELNGDDPQVPGRPVIHCHMLSAKQFGGVNTRGYAMKLEFGKDEDGGIPGKLYLCLPDEKKSWIAGSFTLTLK